MLVYVIRFLLRKRRHVLFDTKEIPLSWHSILRKNVPMVQNIPQRFIRELHTRILIFLDEKEIRGCQGLEITEEMRVTIAAQACLLLLNKPIDTYSGLYTVLVYPSSFRSHQQKQDEMGISSRKEQHRIGESWTRGHVILSWKHSKEGGKKPFDGHNVVIHEFAHQLDQLDGYTDGVPYPVDDRARWIETFQKRYQEIKEQWDKKGRKPFLRKYGVTNPAEFFAVASELFFECPKRLCTEYPEIYEELALFYKLDPKSW